MGTQTGTAQGFAEELSRESGKYNYRSTVMDLEYFGTRGPAGRDQETRNNFLNGKYGICIFIVATYGEGDPTENAQEFMTWLMNTERTNDNFSNIQYTVFGLGNRQYEHFNKMGKSVHGRLETLGAKLVYKYGEGDDDGSMDIDFQTWREGLWLALQALNASTDNGSPSGDIVRSITRTASINTVSGSPSKLEWTVNFVNDKKMIKTYESLQDTGIMDANERTERVTAAGRASKPYYEAVTAKVVKNIELRPSERPTGSGSTRHVEIDVGSVGLSYVTADNLYICPDNETELVETTAKLLNVELDKWFTLEPNQNSGSTISSFASSSASTGTVSLFPSPCTVRTALTRYCNLAGRVDRIFLTQLVSYIADANERNYLTKILAKENRKDFDQWAVLPQRNFVEALQYFKSLEIDFSTFIQIIPRLQPRAYTIASSSLAFPRIASICVSVIDTPKTVPLPEQSTNSSRRLHGVCSSQLARTGNSLRVYIHTSSFRLPTDISIPIIMIGPGTGIAPMMAFLQERRYQRQNNKSSTTIGDTILYFGCRRSNEDYIYEQELKSYVKDKTLTGYHTAFSRENPNQKVYVQDRLLESSEQIYKYIDKESAYIYVCGATKMGSDVLATIHKIVQEQGKLTKPETDKYIKQLQESHRYVQELWSA